MRKAALLALILCLGACAVIDAEQRSKDTGFPERIRTMLMEMDAQAEMQCGPLNQLRPGKGAAYEQCRTPLFDAALIRQDVPFEDIRNQNIEERAEAMMEFDRHTLTNAQLRERLQATEAKTLRYYEARQKAFGTILNLFSGTMEVQP